MIEKALELNYLKCPICGNSYALYFHRKSMERHGMCAHCYKKPKEQTTSLDKQESKLMDWVDLGAGR